MAHHTLEVESDIVRGDKKKATAILLNVSETVCDGNPEQACRKAV